MIIAVSRGAARHAEAKRDLLVVRAALQADIAQILEAARLADSPLQELWLSVYAAVTANQQAASALDALRETLRRKAAAAGNTDSVPLPQMFRFFRHRGNYHGTRGSLRELGNALRPALRIPGEMTPDARANVARTLHLRGELWTYEHDQQIHVFARPGSTVDTLLASERPREVDPPLEQPKQVTPKQVSPAALPTEREPDAPVIWSRPNWGW